MGEKYIPQDNTLVTAFGGRKINCSYLPKIAIDHSDLVYAQNFTRCL